MNFFHRTKLSAEAKRAADLIACGAALRVPFDDSQATVVMRQPYTPDMFKDQWPADLRQLLVSPEVVTELMETGYISLLTRKRHMNKIGWQEAGLDGRTAEFWCLTQ